MNPAGPMRLDVEIERWPLARPLRVTGYTFEFLDVVLLRLEHGGHIGQGEAAGVYFRNDRPESIRGQIESLRREIEAGLDRELLQRALPRGGARNALDCALWDLEAKLTGQPVWRLAGLQEPRPLLTTFPCGADSPGNMAELARSHRQAKAIKLKLTGEPIDAERVIAVREARPDVWLGVDANQGFTRNFLEQLMAVFMQTRVALIEQPFPVGRDALLEGFRSPIPVAADESAESPADLDRLAGLYDVINIKLDKSGGLTEALAMARAVQQRGLDGMIGNMIGTSLAMAPAFLVGQLCQVIDLDGPMFLRDDRPQTVRYADGYISSPEALWGYPK
jgi:L-alanine-DL-glutamate epimerase-like enolase superfamily enzyme